jgi:leucine dehydrogenase
MDHPGLDRDRAFEVFGGYVESLGGQFRTAGDLGTRHEDLVAMARSTQFVHLDEVGLSDAVAVGLVGCMEACARVKGLDGIQNLRVAIQGCGAIGAAAARRVREAGAEVLVCDIDDERARAVAAATGAERIAPERFEQTPCDILAPCAVGQVVTSANVRSIDAWALCGAANRILESSELSATLMQSGKIHVPDIIASAGAVVQGIAKTVMGEVDPAARVLALGRRAEAVLRESARTGESPIRVAETIARHQIGIP